MTKKEQIEEMAKAIPKGVDYDNNECYIIGDSVHIAKTLYNAGYRKNDEFAECRNCSAWSGTDCTRHPYTQGCLKDETNVKGQDVEEIALLKSELKKELDEHEAFVNNMKNVLEIEKKNAVREFVEQFKEKARKGAFRDPVTYKFIERDYTVTESELTKMLEEFFK